MKAINKEEVDLLEELKQLAKTGPDFDEEPLKLRAQNLISRRRDVSLILDDQNKFSISGRGSTAGGAGDKDPAGLARSRHA